MEPTDSEKTLNQPGTNASTDIAYTLEEELIVQRAEALAEAEGRHADFAEVLLALVEDEEWRKRHYGD